MSEAAVALGDSAAGAAFCPRGRPGWALAYPGTKGIGTAGTAPRDPARKVELNHSVARQLQV